MAFQDFGHGVEPGHGTCATIVFMRAAAAPETIMAHNVEKIIKDVQLQ